MMKMMMMMIMMILMMMMIMMMIIIIMMMMMMIMLTSKDVTVVGSAPFSSNSSTISQSLQRHAIFKASSPFYTYMNIELVR